ncbi:glyoxal oxidase [Microvirga massiliensis]|uniref:glyoxal oxidase n=1 Tax=Microvirga massiliensis TaxID=1033741 RepID=UPI00062B58E2|nr:glyoxal oxidase [Microvirga massiliensis]
MSITDGAWDAPVDNAIATEKIRYGPQEVDDPRDLFVIHAALLHTGKVLWFSGHTESMHYATVSYSWDPDTGALTRIPFPPGVDLFCCHYVHLEDGRLLTLGGSDFDFSSNGSYGAKNILLFDPMPTRAFPAGRWIQTGKELLQGRWYPTAVLLGDGRVLVFSGRLEPNRTSSDGRIIANWVEVLTPPDFTPRRMTGADFTLPIYPGLHLAPDGRVYYTHTNWGQELPEPTTRALQITGPTAGTWNDFGVLPGEPRRREEGMSVLLPPAQEGKILVVGGSTALNPAGTPVLQPGGGGTGNMDHIADGNDPRRANILNTRPGGPPNWTPAPGGGMTNLGRINGHLVLLPDATVLVCGGHNHYKWKSIANGTTPSLPAEIFTPAATAARWPARPAGFRAVASMTHPRMYHSTALLLPDGRVVVAGGADRNGSEPQLPWPATWPANLRWNAGVVALNRKEREVYRPPYFFNPGRPTISAVTRNGAPTTQIPYGTPFVVTTPQAASIRLVALMRPGATTHHTDSEQRFVTLDFTRAGNDLTVTMLPQAENSTAPPGWYMLWIVDDQQRPCERARFLQIPGPLRPRQVHSLVPRKSSWPCIVATVAMGSEDAPEVLTLRRVRFNLEQGTTGGRIFIRAVNRAYYAVSPWIATRLACRENWRLATRDLAVRPSAAAVGAVERTAARIQNHGLRHAATISLLILLGVAALTVTPIIAIAIAACAGFRIGRTHRPIELEGEAPDAD